LWERNCEQNLDGEESISGQKEAIYRENESVTKEENR